MYRRDFGVILLSIFALYWSLQHEGSYEYKEAFFYKLSYNEDLGSAHYPLPPPVVVRLIQFGRFSTWLALVTSLYVLLPACCVPVPSLSRTLGV